MPGRSELAAHLERKPGSCVYHPFLPIEHCGEARDVRLTGHQRTEGGGVKDNLSDPNYPVDQDLDLLVLYLLKNEARNVTKPTNLNFANGVDLAEFWEDHVRDNDMTFWRRFVVTDAHNLLPNDEIAFHERTSP
jgi:hypothetical protein